MFRLLAAAKKRIGNSKKYTIAVNAPISWLNDLLAPRAAGEISGLFPVGVWVFIVLLIALSIFLRYTRTGRHIYAIGSNEQTARLCGIAVHRVKLVVYMLSAGFAGLAGVMQFSRLSVGDPTVAVGLELDVIAAVVIGGGSLSGGEGTVLGSVIGALIMTGLEPVARRWVYPTGTGDYHWRYHRHRRRTG